MKGQKQKCGILFKQINSELEKNANNALRADNLTLSQISVLIELDETPEKCMDMKTMEKRIHVAQSTLAGVVKRLEDKGFIKSRSSERDRRVKIIELTEAGKKCCEKAAQSADKAEEQMLSSLTETEREILLSLLIKVRQSFR